MVIFDWNDTRDKDNIIKHGVSFYYAQHAFFDENRLIIKDEKHSATEERWFCIGRVEDRVITVRFAYRNNVIRIFGAAEWRKWRKFYEKHQS
jgi:uncharacterized DUF497 family protein